MNDLNKQIQEKIDYGYFFNLSKYVEQGFYLFKRNLSGFVAFTILFLLIQMTAGNLGGAMAFVFLLAAPALHVGWYYVAHKVHNNQTTEPLDFFKGFQEWGRLMGMYLIMVGVFLLLILPVFGAMAKAAIGSEGGIEEVESLTFVQMLDHLPSWAFLVILPMIYLTVIWRWAPLFIIFYKMDAWQALETSRKLINKKWFILFVFTVLLGVLSGGGELFRLIGFSSIFVFGVSAFLVPLSACIEYEAFAEVTGLNEEQASDITEHLVD